MDVFLLKKVLCGYLINNVLSGCDSFVCYLENRVIDEILYVNIMKLGLFYLVLFEFFILDILCFGIWVIGVGFFFLFYIIIDLD